MDAHLQQHRDEIWIAIHRTLAGCNPMALIQLLWAARKIARKPGVKVAADDEELSRKTLAYAKPERRGRARNEDINITKVEDMTYELPREGGAE